MPNEPLSEFNLQLNITNWKKSTDYLFDYQTSQYKDFRQFQSEMYQLHLPKPSKCLYYFFYALQPLDHIGREIITIQRRKQCMPNIQQVRIKKNNPSLQLLCGIQVFNKNIKGQESSFMKVLSAKAIYQLCQFKTLNLKFQIPYLIVRTFSRGYPLKVNQILKIGRNQFYIKQVEDGEHKIDFSNYKPEQVLVVQDKQDQRLTSMNVVEEEQKNCKICYEASEVDANGEYNPLLSPCKCVGSTRYIHLSCLSEWIDEKIRKLRSEGEGYYYQFKQLFCEICKHPFPKAAFAKNKYYSLINFIEKSELYVALQQKDIGQKLVRNVNAQDANLSYITMSHQNKKATIGRLIESGVVLEGMTVSRRHAMIQYIQKTGFKIRDLQSKFGTLLYQQGAQIQLRQKYRSLQIGPLTFNFKLMLKKQ